MESPRLKRHVRPTAIASMKRTQLATVHRRGVQAAFLVLAALPLVLLLGATPGALIVSHSWRQHSASTMPSEST
jgi:hypothetical protein